MSAVMDAVDVVDAVPARLPAPVPVAPPPSGPRWLVGSRVGQILWTFRREFAWVVVFSIFTNLLMLTPTLYMLQVFDRVALSGNGFTLVALTLLMVLFTATMAFAEWLRSRLLVRAGGRFDEALNRHVFDAAFTAQLAGKQRNPQQPLIDMNSLRQFLTGNGVFAIVDTPWTVIFIVVLFLMHPWLGWAAVLFCVVQITLGFTVQAWSARQRQQLQELAVDAGQYLQAKMRNAETVESMGMQGNLRRQWGALHDKQMGGHAQSAESSRRLQALMKWVQYTQQGLMLSLGALLAIDGKITAGAMVASNALMGNALRPIGLIVQIWGQSTEARAAFQRLNHLLDARPAQPVEPPAPKVLGQITLRGLKATAPGRATPILKGLDIEFRAGEVLGIIGPSGAGKSTLARCLLGIWPGREGEVLIDGHPIESWPRELLGQQLGYLPQDIELFDGSIAENIARFRDVDPSVVIDAATRAGIHDMVLRLPAGYDTPIGEAGSMLSGGQRQRLGLARALLGMPAIVVLDEPGANLDDTGEAALVQVVRQLKARGTTVFMIVHQQHMLAVADRVLVLEAGQVSKLLQVQVAPAVPAAPTAPAAPVAPIRT